jgi:hypothetical protein
MAAPGSRCRISDTPSPVRLRNSGSFQNDGRKSCSGMDTGARLFHSPERVVLYLIVAAGWMPAPPRPLLAYLLVRHHRHRCLVVFPRERERPFAAVALHIPLQVLDR